MDFHGMNRKNLQILCKKHGIPANLKNTEMANRLASLFQKEDEETVTEPKTSPEEEEEVVASRKAKKVRFSSETDNQVFEFTRSVKKIVRTRRGVPQQGGGMELRRSRRSVSKGIGSDGDDVSSSVSGIVEAEKGHSNSVRSKRIGSVGGGAREEVKDRGLIAVEQGGRRSSTRLAVKAGASKSVALLPAGKRAKGLVDGSKGIGSDGDVSSSRSGVVEAEKGPSNSVKDARRRSKRIGSVGSSDREEVKDRDLIALEQLGDKCVQGGRRSSTRLAVKTGTSKLLTLLPVGKRAKGLVDVADKEDEKETGEVHRKDDDSKVELVRRRSMRFVSEQTSSQDQRRSVRVKASVENTLMSQAKNDSVKASRVVKGNRLDKKKDENPVKSSKRVTRNMKRVRTGEPGVDSGTASNQSNLSPKKTMDEFAPFEEEEACEADVKAGGSSKKSKTMNQECIKDKPQGIIITEDSPSSSQAKAAESVMILEKVLDQTLDKSDDSSQRSNTREINREPMEGECEEKLERDTVLMPVMEEDKEEVSPRSLSGPEDKLHVPTGHIIVKDIASTVTAEENTKTKDEPLPEYVLKEQSSIAKLANIEEILENSTERRKEIHSGKDDEKGSLEKDVQAENLHGNVSECNTENSSAEEMEIGEIGVMCVAHRLSLTPEELLGVYAQLGPEEAERHNVKDRSSSQKIRKAVSQEFVKDKPQGLAEDSPSTSETKATEPVLISKNVLDSTRKVQGETSAVRNSQELDSELLEETLEEKHEQATKKDKGEASSLSEVKTSPDNRSTGCSLSVETTLPTGDDVVSAVITEEDNITKEKTLIFTPASELKEQSSAAELAKVEAILGNSAECFKENEEGSLEKDVQADDLYLNFSEGNTENPSAEEEMEISKDSMSANLTPEKLLDTYTQLVPEEAGGSNVEIRSSSKKMKTVGSDLLKENPQGMAEDSPSTSVTKTAETIMMSENVSIDISPVGNIQESTGLILVEEDIKTEEVPKSVQSFVAKLAETDAVLENSSECWNESLSSKDEERGSLEKEKQSAKRHGNFSEYNAENSSAEEQADICKVGRISDGHCVDRETLDEVKDESLMKSVQTKSSEGGCKPNGLELSGSLSTDFASHTHKEENVSECLEEEEMKALSQPASNVLDRSSLFTTPERNLMLMEQLSESGKTCEAHIVTQHNNESLQSHAVVFTTPEKVLLLGDSGLDEVGKEEEYTTTDFPDDLNTTQNESFNEEERIVVELHDESDIAAGPLRQPSVGNLKEDRAESNEEYGTVELHCDSATGTGPDKHAALANFVSDGAENSGGNKAIEFYEESVAFTGLEEMHELFGDSEKDKAREDEVKMDAQFHEEAGLSTEIPLADPELGEAGSIDIGNADQSGSLEGQLLYGNSEQKKAVKLAEKEAAEFHDQSAVPGVPERHPFPEESELDEATKSEENNALELQADCDNFTGANITAKSHDMSDVLTVSESHSIMGAFEPDGEENKDVKLLAKSNISTNEESGPDEKIIYNTAATCEESFVFISPERRHHLGNSEPLTAGKQELKEVEFQEESAFFTSLETRLLLGESGQDRLGNAKSGSTKHQSHSATSPIVILKDDSVVLESQVAAPDFGENTIADSSGSKVSHSHEFSAGEETAGAEFTQKASQVENVAGLDAIQGTSKQSRGNSPHVVDTCHTMDAERNVSFSSYVLALPAEGNSETIGEISNHIEVAGTCSLVSEEAGPSTDIQNQIHDAVEELPVTDVDEIIDAKLPAEGDSNPSQLEVTVTSSMVSEKSTPSMDNQNHIDDALEEELIVTDNSKADSSDGSDVAGKTCVLAGTEDEQHLGYYNSEVTDLVDTAFEKDISLTPDESTLQKSRNEEVNEEATLSPEEALVKPSGESGSSTSSEKQVRRESILIYRTQAKPKRHDMKENAPNSKIVDNLNVTAPRRSKRQPLQDLRKN